VAVAAPAGAVWVRLRGTAGLAAELDAWERASSVDGHWQLSWARLPAGEYLVGARAFADPAAAWTAQPDYETAADVPVAIGEDEAPLVALVLRQERAPPALQAARPNRPPSIVCLFASAVLVGSDPPERLDLRAVVHDPDGPADVASVRWSQGFWPPAPAPGTFTAPAALSTSWTPPPGYEGIATITFTVTDRSGARASLALHVLVHRSRAHGNARVIVRINGVPDVTALTASTGQLAPGAGATFTVAASDADGDALRYAWSDDCGGTFQGPASASAAWSAPSTPGDCTVTVAVADWSEHTPPAQHGPATTSTLVVHVRESVVGYGWGRGP
jgi:hypothetical protein